MQAHSPFVLLRLRWLQLRRAFPSYGIVLLVLVAGGAVWLLRSVVLRDPFYTPYITGAALLTAGGMHQRRADHHFLLRQVPGARVAMAVEYGVLLLPLLVGLVLAGVWAWAALLPLACALPWLPLVRASGVRARWVRTFIPVRLFEWRSLLQRTHPGGLLLWLVALAFCWLPVLPLFLLGAITLLAAGAQEQCEPRSMLLATATDARTLLRRKVRGAMLLLLVMELPLLIGATAAIPAWWWIHALFGAGMLVLLAYAVVLKYANYVPNERLDANNANVGVAAVFAILPGLCVVPLVMLLTEWPKARANLNAYFHAHHR